MIKLKNIINELTSHNFEVPKQTNEMKVTAALMNSNIPVGLGDQKAALKRAKSFEGGKMFIHIQYHFIQHKDHDPLFIHQTQYYVTGHEVNCTQLYVEEVIDYDGGNVKNAKKKELGRIMVPTDKLLKGLKRVKVLNKG
tara:strand:+ start:137 stop:553 length:417 start_codon:yes stop_codon:yes gene_type:complete